MTERYQRQVCRVTEWPNRLLFNAYVFMVFAYQKALLYRIFANCWDRYKEVLSIAETRLLSLVNCAL